MRETSLAAYRQLKESGQLGRRKLQVAEKYANADRPMTDREISSLFTIHDMPNNAVNTRISELIRDNVLVEHPARLCAISGKMARTADLNPNKPVPLPKKQAVYFWIGLDESNTPIAVRKHPDKPLGGNLVRAKQLKS